MDPGSSPFSERVADINAISTPAGIKLAWRHAIHEQKLLNRILKLNQLAKVNIHEKRKIIYKKRKKVIRGCSLFGQKLAENLHFLMYSNHSN